MYGAVEVELATGRITELVVLRKHRAREQWMREAPPGRVRTSRAARTVLNAMRWRSEGREMWPVHPGELVELRRRAGWQPEPARQSTATT